VHAALGVLEISVKLLRVAVLVAGLTIIGQASGAGDLVAGISVSDFAIAGISSDATIEVVDAVFGRRLPLNCEPKPTFCTQECGASYKGVEAYYCDGKLVNLLCKTPKYKTPKGLHVGMTAIDVFKLQGITEQRTVEGGELLIYRVTGRDASLLLHLRGAKVTAIELWVDFT
jgi:hypothetical protein